MENKRTTTYRRPATTEARERANAYLRNYRKAHPDKAKRWREDYIIRKAQRLIATRTRAGENEKGGDSDD